MSEEKFRNLINHLLTLYHTVFPSSKSIPISITLTDDLNKTHAELRPEEANRILLNNAQSDFNGRMVPSSENDPTFHILLNKVKFDEYTKDQSYTWAGTVAHEYTHALDFHGIAEKEGLSNCSTIEEMNIFSMFYQWTEYHARKKGYIFLRKFIEEISRMPSKNEQITHILNTEAPYQTKLYQSWYKAGTPEQRLYYTMQYLGRYSVWMDLFPTVFGKEKLMNYCPVMPWMWDVLMFLREHEELDDIYGHFEELNGILKCN